MGKMVLGIDIGGTNTKFGLVKEDGGIIAKSSISTTAFEHLEGLFAAMKNMIEKSTSFGQIEAVGIGAPNGNHYTGHIEHAPNLKWKGKVNIKGIAESVFGIRTTITNDANAAAIGELVFGKGRGYSDFIVITLGTGLGSGFVVNGKILYGHDGFAGELGHSIVYPGGRECTCGRKGCLETYVSARGIVKTVHSLLAAKEDQTALRNIPYNELTPLAIYKAAKEGDAIALAAFDETAKILAIKLADAVVCTSPKAIFLLGGIASAGDFLFNPLQKHFNHYNYTIFKGKVELLPSGLESNDAGILGAAALVM